MTLHPLEILRGRPTNAPALVKHAVRFGRRLRQHGICYAEFPSLINDGRSACKIIIGARMVNVFDDGSCMRSLMRSDNSLDGRAFLAQSHRMHAIYLSMARESRR